MENSQNKETQQITSEKSDTDTPITTSITATNNDNEHATLPKIVEAVTTKPTDGKNGNEVFPKKKIF